ncbi:MAG TPA: hypothetical protein VE569_06940, partial [Acidimicrobiia bacterium]|nr:hypothetical protein [Acidimicrobiia bacterium]
MTDARTSSGSGDVWADVADRFDDHYRSVRGEVRKHVLGRWCLSVHQPETHRPDQGRCVSHNSASLLNTTFLETRGARFQLTRRAKGLR